MKPLKLAVIGAGHLGRIHARLLKEMNDVEVIGVVDPVESARAAVASECGITAYADHRELLEAAEGAVIATPTRHHHAVAIDFLRFGTPLLIEKPITENVAEANEIVLLAERHGTLVQVGHIERFNPAFLAAADYIQRPRYVEAVRAAGFTGRSTDIGVVLDLMIHDIDLVLAMVGTPVVRVSALGFAVLGRHEDVAQARLEFACGAVANLSASRVSYSATPKRQMQIWSERGFVSLDFANRSATAVSPSDAVRRHELDFHALDPASKTACKERLATDILRMQPLEVPTTNALADELRDFVESIRHNRQPRVTARQGRDAVALAEQVLGSIRTHRWQGRTGGAVGPLAEPAATLRGPHWLPATAPRPAA